MLSQISSCKFRKDKSGRWFYNIICHDKPMIQWQEVKDDPPLYNVGDIYVIPGGAKNMSAIIPAHCGTISADYLDCGLAIYPRIEYLRKPLFPALMEYPNGRSAFLTKTRDGDLIISVGISPISTFIRDYRVVDTLPDKYRKAFLKASHHFLEEISYDAVHTFRSVSAKLTAAANTAYEFNLKAKRPIYVRGEKFEYLLMAFQEDDGSIIVTGLTNQSCTLTLTFPFLEPNAEYKATWLDDKLDYYAKGELEVRPETVTQSTKSAVKMADNGGFLLCLTR